MLGDLHCNLASPTPDANTHHSLAISDLYGLKQLINEPTRLTESLSTLIDLIYTNSTDWVGCSSVSHIAISDHNLVYVYYVYLTEIFEILKVEIVEMKSLNKTGHSIWYGQTGKQNFCALLTHMLVFKLDVLN